MLDTVVAWGGVGGDPEAPSADRPGWHRCGRPGRAVNGGSVRYGKSVTVPGVPGLTGCRRGSRLSGRVCQS